MRFTFSTERLGCVLGLHRRSFGTLTFNVLVCEHFDNVARSKVSTVHLQVENDILVTLRETAQQANRNVLVFHLGADAAQLRADIQHLIAMV